MNIWLEMLFWFFAITGFVVLLYDTAHYFMYKNTLPAQMTLLIRADALGPDRRLGIANLINLLYEQNPSGKYDLIVLDDTESAALKHEINTIADATDCVYIANTENVARYIKQSMS